MKVLLDSCVSRLTIEPLRNAGHDVLWTGDWPSDPGDAQILQAAASDGRILITIDKDFGELAVLQGVVHTGIIRLVGFRSAEQGPAIVRLLQAYESELQTGALLTAEPWRVRIRPG